MPEQSSQADSASALPRQRKRFVRMALLVGVLCLVGLATFAQRSGFPGMRGSRQPQGVVDRYGTPDWELNRELPKDIFTFVRIIYSSSGGRYGGGGWGGRRWAIDYPDADINLAYRLQEMTSLKVDPTGKTLEITDPELLNYPFCYIVEPGYLHFSEEEVLTLRKYLMNGGFLMVDDFWGEAEWENFYNEIKRVFPDREPQDIPMDHPVFHCVFDLGKDKNKLQVPNVNLGIQSEFTGITWEREDAHDVHIRGIFDDKGRLMVIACHNTDNGDGWEREGESAYYFREFSEKKSYPLGINIIFYAMTH